MANRVSTPLFLALVMVAMCSAAPQSETYSSRYDKVDLQGLLADPSRVRQFLQCFLQEGDGEPCDEMARRVKAVLHEALPQDCAKCTAPQRAGLARTVQFLAAAAPERWQQLQKKFDPEGAYAKAHPELF